jgi:hypothetical protein
MLGYIYVTNTALNTKANSNLLGTGWHPEDQGGKERPSGAKRPSVQGLLHRGQRQLRDLGLGGQAGKPGVHMIHLFYFVTDDEPNFIIIQIQKHFI